MKGIGSVENQYRSHSGREFEDRLDILSDWPPGVNNLKTTLPAFDDPLGTHPFSQAIGMAAAFEASKPITLIIAKIGF